MFAFLNLKLHKIPGKIWPTSEEEILFLFIAWWDVDKLVTIKIVTDAQKGIELPRYKGSKKFDEVIYYHNKIFVPESLRMDLIYNCHSLLLC